MACGKATWRCVAAIMRRETAAAALGGPLAGLVGSYASGRARVLPDAKPTLPASLVIHSFLSAGGGPAAAAAPAAASMEFLFAAGDLLDDVQDGEFAEGYERRPVGLAMAALTALLLLSRRCLSACGQGLGVPASRVLAASLALDGLSLFALGGQQQDLELEDARGVPASGALAVAARKSASLTQAAAMVGAMLATDEREMWALHGRLGWYLGIAAQLLNDIRGAAPGGGTDLALSKRTLPAVLALAGGASVSPAGGDVGQGGLATATPGPEGWASPALYVPLVAITVASFRARELAERLGGLTGRPWALGPLFAE